MKYLKKIVSLSLILVFPSLAMSLSHTSSFPSIITLSTGPVWQSAGSTQTLTLASDIEKTYTANNTSRTLIAEEVFLGKQLPLKKKFRGQLGIAFVTTGPAKLTGDIWDDADPQFDNYTYQYQIKHTHFAVKGKLLLDINPILSPWISASLGIGLNQAENFTNTPTIEEAIANPNFRNNTQTTFTYTVGAGINCILTSHLQAGIGYEFADWGKSHLNPAPQQSTNESLSLSHLYTSGILINLTYNS